MRQPIPNRYGCRSWRRRRLPSRRCRSSNSRYLTGVIVAPSLIRPGLWMAGLWPDEEPVFDDALQMQSVLAALGMMLNTLGAKIEQSLRRLEAERVCDYRPAFCIPDARPPHDKVSAWVRGFWRAMQLAPSDWSPLLADERTQVILTPFVDFMNVESEPIELADDIEDRLDEAAEAIPRSILLLRKIAEIRAGRGKPAQPIRHASLFSHRVSVAAVADVAFAFVWAEPMEASAERGP
jgi:uncharacterized protein